jgi:hypothetical protein
MSSTKVIGKARLSGRGLAAVLVLGVLGAGTASAQIAFSDQTAAAGLVHHPNMYDDLSSGGMFAGGAVADFNVDGWPDIFLLGGGDALDALFLNNGDGTFTDRAADWGLGTPHRGLGATAGDFNNDGWPDLYVTSGGALTGGNRAGQHRLYRNNGDGTFTDVATAAGVNQSSPISPIATGAAFGDYDLDGDLDLFVCTWEGYDGNRLFRNDGNETFTDVTLAAGIEQDLFFGFSPRFVDMNGDRYPELLVAADFMTSRYFVNNQDGTFTDITAASGTGLDDNGMGTTVGDFNRDGLPDWYVTSIYWGTSKKGNYLYVNQGNDQYTALPESAGAKQGGWGWGTDAVDFDHDGYLDLVETNGWTAQYENVSAFLFHNNGDMTFGETQDGSGFDHTGQGRSILLLDYDRDGDMDIAITSYDEPVKLFRNDLSGPDTNWIEIRLDTSGDPALAPDGYGAKVIATAGGVTQYFWLNGGATYLGRSQPVAHFGLYDATSVDLVVEWPDGSTTSLFAVPVNQILTLTPVVAGAPGEASRQSEAAEQLLAGYNGATGEIEVSYTPGCGCTNHTIYYGDLANVASYDYAGAACWRGANGSTSFDPAGVTDAFFLIVGNDGTIEGGYGRDGSGAERLEDTSTVGCDLPQDLSGTCDLP